MKYKLIILYTLCCIFLFITLIYFGRKISKEGLTDFEKYSYSIIPYPKDATINYNDVHSPLYSHTVDLPINNPISCKNFCGPKSQCAITREQCTSDVDCKGCKPQSQHDLANMKVEPYDATGKLGQNMGLQYSPLTTGYNNNSINFEEVYPGSKDAQIKPVYQGVDTWTKSFNEGLDLYNKKQEVYDKYNKVLIDDAIGKLPVYKSSYPTTITATGQFYNTIAPAANSSLS
jgi:hypothetical protein